MKMKKILVIGSLNMDMVTHVAHIPVAGETILGDGLELIPGGKGANQACAAGRLGASVVMLGAVGTDSNADTVVRSLTEAGVDTARIIRRKNSNTGTALICVNADGDNSIVVIPGANATLTEQDIDRNTDLLKACDILILQMEIPIRTVLYAAQKAKAYGKYVILDPAPAPEHFPQELYQYVDILKPNETELGILTGISHAEKHLEEAVEILKACGVSNVIVTLGEKGVYIKEENRAAFRLAAKRVQAVDTTAAGDSFTAALAVMLSEGSSLVDAAEFANVAAAVVVTRKGAQSSIPTKEEVWQQAFVGNRNG